jgi:hypothetical protein
MKNITLFLLLMMSFVVNGFGQKSLIHGTTAMGLPYKYAYLYDPDTKVLLCTPINDREFRFEVAQSDQLKILALSFNTQLFSTYREVLESRDFKYPNGARMVAIEDTVKVTLKEFSKDAIVEGQSLNKDIDSMYAAIKSLNFKAFFEQHPNSPVAIVFLQTLTESALKGSSLFTIADCRLSYQKLADRLKNSDEGKNLLTLISK